MAQLEALKGLHQDLIAVAEARLYNVERLCAELEQNLDEFKNLLKKKARNEASRSVLNSGKITLEDEEYTVNDLFKQGALQVADILDLDEIQAAQLYLNAQNRLEYSVQSPTEGAIIRFHEYRRHLLDCICLICRTAVNNDINHDIKQLFQEVVSRLTSKNGADACAGSASFVGNCLSQMTEIRKWKQDVTEKMQAARLAGSSSSDAFFDIMNFQEESLTGQHETIGLILAYVARTNEPQPEHFNPFFSILSSLEKYDVLLIHHVPYLASLFSQFTSVDSSATLDRAKIFHNALIAKQRTNSWAIRSFHAAVTAWWLSEYAAFFHDERDELDFDADDSAEASERLRIFKEAVTDGAFDFTMSLSADIKTQEWSDPIRHGLRKFLQGKAPSLAPGSPSLSEPMQLGVLEATESFVDAFITNMPDVIRQLRYDEEEQRRLTQATRYNHDLEKFLVTISYTFERRPEAAQAFWADNDGNFYGFLQWASKRPSTPRASALCEVLTALSEGGENADAAHNFLLDDGQISMGKMRRTNSITWNQILSELQFYVSKIVDRAPVVQTSNYAGGLLREDKDSDQEKEILLESYLRLASHLCRESHVCREWLLSFCNINIIDLCFSLCSSNSASKIRACAFDLITSLLREKSQALSEAIWVAVEQWTSGSIPNQSFSKQAQTSQVASWTGKKIFDTISTSFDESNEFLRLLQSLLLPSDLSVDLNDLLPFPEQLGSSTRLSTVENYIDFALGTVFAVAVRETKDVLQQRTLRLTCLDLIACCLSTFNEDLVIFANRSNISVDSAIRTSTLAAYVRLHPFARVMEWLFNDKVVDELFRSAIQNVTDVNNASVDTPLFYSVLRAIEVITMILNLQATYLDIVRPEVKIRSIKRSPSVANPALAFFEDAILNHLDIVPHLGLYCGTDHHELTGASLTLLSKLSGSQKLMMSNETGFGQRHGRNKLISALEKSGESEQISRILTNRLQLDLRELEQGPDTPIFSIKTGIISFLDSCLALTPEMPTIADLLLGFSIKGSAIFASEKSGFAKESSTFHCLLNLAVNVPEVEDGNFQSWLSHLKSAATQVLRRLWKARLSSRLVMAELRSHDYLFAQFIHQTTVNANTTWDGVYVSDDQFFLNTSASCLGDFMRQRLALFEYTASELRLVSEAGSSTVKDRILSTLLGLTIAAEGDALPNPTVFNLLDFADLDMPAQIDPPPVEVFSDIDFTICRKENDTGLSLYDIRIAKELIELKRVEIGKSGVIASESQQQQADQEAEHMLLYLHAKNQHQTLLIDRLETLAAWTQMIIVLVDAAEFDKSTKTAFILQTLQAILPKLERYCQGPDPEALLLSSLARDMLGRLDMPSDTDVGESPENIHDRIYQLFKIALRVINLPSTTTDLRTNLYQICLQYMAVASQIEGSVAIGGVKVRSIKALGERFLEIICDDALSGNETSRVSAVMMLEALTGVSQKEESAYVVQGLGRLNFLGILVDSIQNMPDELRDTVADDVPALLSFYSAKLALLLRVSQSRIGATAVANAGLFQAIDRSALFATDPDIGLEIDNPASLNRYYSLLLSTLRIINAVVISQGPENAQTQQAAQKFLSKNRAGMVSVLKRHAGIGGVLAPGQGINKDDLEELVENWVLLVAETDFIKLEDSILAPRGNGMFT